MATSDAFVLLFSLAHYFQLMLMQINFSSRRKGKKTATDSVKTNINTRFIGNYGHRVERGGRELAKPEQRGVGSMQSE